MSTKTQKILIILSVVLIIGALCALIGVFAFSGKNENKSGNVHPAEETFYNDDGSVNRVVYYDNDVYQGQTDYYSEGNKDYIIKYGADSSLVSTEITEKNVSGKIVSHKIVENGKTIQNDEYIYQDDTETLKKVTKKSYDSEGKETAEKLYYGEDGETVTERYTFFDGKELTHEVFDEKNPYKQENK